ncbi:ubiquitin-protein ligase E3C [Hetaerina americana]|uniref:ubiquitin-protein ligase E3C n=1 Tax=Hetaerina americana TaxID=62018 RepID=UPI003A7F3C66
MFSFEGDFRRRPQQDLSGATRKEKREALLQRAQSERLKREESRRQHNSAILIQAFYRGHRTRCFLEARLREEFDCKIREGNLSQWTVEDLVKPIRCLLTFYNDSLDAQRLACISQLLIRLSKVVIKLSVKGSQIPVNAAPSGCVDTSKSSSTALLNEGILWSWRIRRLLHICLCRALSIATVTTVTIEDDGVASGGAAGMALPLRIFEVFTFKEGLEDVLEEGSASLVVRHLFQTYQFLIRKGYFEQLRWLIEQRTPPLMGVSPRPPTHLAACLVDLLARPLLLLSSLKEPDHIQYSVLRLFARHILSPLPSEAIRLFVLPYLSSLSTFPFVTLLEALQPNPYPADDGSGLIDLDDEDSEDDSYQVNGKGSGPRLNLYRRHCFSFVRDEYSQKRVHVPHTTWLLHSLLTLEGRQYGLNRDAMGGATLNYLRILACLTTWISKGCRRRSQMRESASSGQPHSNSPLYSGSTEEDDEEDGESEDEEDPSRASKVAREERQAIEECIVMLNDPGRVNNLLAAVEHSKDPGVLNALCRLCHNLLLSRHLAVHQFRLLYMLAFKPSFLRSLWSAILNASQVSPLFGPTSESVSHKSSSSSFNSFQPSNSRLNLLRLISRGVETSPEETGRIVPLLAVFSTLFTLLIVTLHDGEFYGDDSLPGGSSTSQTSITQEQSALSGNSQLAQASQQPQQKIIQTSSSLNASISSQVMPFSLPELASLSLSLKDACLGLVELAFPESRPGVHDDYRTALRGQPQTEWAYGTDGIGQLSAQGSFHNQKRRLHHQKTKWRKRRSRHVWSHLFKVCVSLLRQLHTRDARRPFCPDGHWISRQVAILQTEGGASKGQPGSSSAVITPMPSSDITLRRRSRPYRPFQGLRALTQEEMEEGPPLSTREIRTATILREVPFVVAFQERVLAFQGLILRDKMERQGEASYFLQGPSIHITLRRAYLYEDAYEKLSPENEPDLRLKMRVQLVNAVGMSEAGVDGGGVFREFLSELIKTTFDPNRGFFRLTRYNTLYPSPGAPLIFGQDFPRHYYFAGRILGKALYENLLVELPLADFFLSKIVGRHSNVDVHHLASMDPLMHRNLIYLKSYDGDIADLNLDFTVINEELGETRIDELKSGGANIPVTAANRIEYIHLMADYKLNRQIRVQCSAFKQGLANVIPLEWLQMFDTRELQVLISGAPIPVDVEDLRRNTAYAGGYSPEHPTIRAFWTVVEQFDDLQRRLLLKFVTSCSRPPLLGFKELDPPFCVQHAGIASDRLPTASTCMNLLKLPEFPDEETLQSRLLYAIQAGAGFELS